MIGNICKLLKKICYQLAEYMEHERGLRKSGREGHIRRGLGKRG